MRIDPNGHGAKWARDGLRIYAHRAGADERLANAQAKRARRAHKRKMDNMTSVAGQIEADKRLGKIEP